MAEEENEAAILPKLLMIQSLIDISVNRLEGLRTKCSPSAELTQQEIRSLEGKLITLFSRQIVVRNQKKSRAVFTHIPSLKQWLQVVGVCSESNELICSKLKTIDTLLGASQYLFKNILCTCPTRDEELRRLSLAHRQMNRYIALLVDGDVNNVKYYDLHWDSWKFQSPTPVLPVTKDNEELLWSEDGGYSKAINGNVSHLMGPYETSLLSPPLTPSRKITENEIINSPQRSPGPLNKQPNVKDQYTYPDCCTVTSVDEISQSFSKCKSPDFRYYPLPTIEVPPVRIMNKQMSGWRSTSTVVSTEHVLSNGPCTDCNIGSFSTCKDMETPRSSLPFAYETHDKHCGRHKFSRYFSVNSKCDLCNSKINIRFMGVKCKRCNYKCHRDCESKVVISCGVAIGLVEEFRKYTSDDRLVDSHIDTGAIIGLKNNIGNCNGDIGSTINKFHNNSTGSICHLDSPTVSRSSSMSSHPSPGLFTQIERKVKLVVGKSLNQAGSTTSSNHSSAPSSPASYIVKDSHSRNQPPATASAVLSQKQRFDFSPDALAREKQTLEDSLTSSGSREYSDVTLCSDKTISQDDSRDSQTWEKTRRIEKAWPRQPSVSMKEWEIPWDELKMQEVLGVGHFGTVYSGYWHGDVAIKLLNMDYMADEKILETFKSEVSTFRKTRHDNLVLFMGACMDIPRLAIVTSLLRGITLYKYIHLRKDKFSMSKTTIIAQQISQGMGYLHAKGILHKDLRTKNIFLEKEKVIITDFGLFNLTKLCSRNRRQDGLVIPPGWLCYLAPEMMKTLRVHVHSDDQQLAFSKASDVYAFGTVWYELLCGDWPFTTHNPEVIIWQVGKGMKQSLANLEASRDVKDILMQCWCYQPSRRPDFTCLLKTLDKLPKKRLARSPSHPVHLSRSAESMF